VAGPADQGNGGSTGDERIALVYEESQRGLEAQAAVLDNMRTRTGVLIAAASIATSFLGGQALADGAAICGWRLAATIAFCAVTVLAFAVIAPWWGWKFTRTVSAMKAGYIDDPDWSPDEMRLELAQENGEWKAANKRKLNCMFWLFRAAVLCLGASVVFWLLALAGH
jgi:hypothetical protein